MADSNKCFFISYSSGDRQWAEILTKHLRNKGAKVWIDYEQIKFGEPVLTRIAEGISGADVLIFLVSHSSGNSPWCRKEYEICMRREILSGRTTVVPIRLDDSPLPVLLEDKRYLNFAELEYYLTELVTGRVSGKASKTAKLVLPSSLLEGLTVLLLMDQFPAGVWGRSLTPLEAAYRHKGDPGSITVSNWCADALRYLQPEGIVPEIQKFTEYLFDRRVDDSGAVGMRKQIGSDFFPKYDVDKNCRHTAVAAQYLYKHCNALDIALKSLRYVMDARTARGAWVDIGEPDDKKADPLTTGTVLGILRAFENNGLLGSVAIHDRELFLARYWKAGLLWLYENLLENDGWWIYEDERRTYCYTTEILMSVPDFWLEDPDYEKAHENLITRIFDLWKKNGMGVPSGPSSDVPSFEATAQYVKTIWRSRDRYPDLNAEIQKKFNDNVENILENGNSNAAGWAPAISHLVHDLGATLSTERDLSFLREIAMSLEQAYTEKKVLSHDLVSFPSWVSNIAMNSILTVTVTPP